MSGVVEERELGGRRRGAVLLEHNCLSGSLISPESSSLLVKRVIVVRFSQERLEGHEESMHTECRAPLVTLENVKADGATVRVYVGMPARSCEDNSGRLVGVLVREPKRELVSKTLIESSCSTGNCSSPGEEIITFRKC